MNPVWTIAKKRDGGELSATEIGDFIRGYVAGQIPDYQMAAWAMAIMCRGMTARETTWLTQHMLDSGAIFTWPAAGQPRVDKHSTGGIGDKVSLPLVPMLACCDLWVPMLSGRGLGSTGGTLDKLEAIPGFGTDLSRDQLRAVVARVGCAISGATPDVVPADRQLYALRDVTATVPSIPLITASIMSKKLAEGLDALVLDVKCGSGAFMKTLAAARNLAHSLVATGRQMGVATTALVTNMQQPLGRMVGNAVEVNESVAVLEGTGPADVLEVTLALGAELLISTGRAASSEEAIRRLQQTIDSGLARERFAELVRAQGGRLQVPLRTAPVREVLAPGDGYVGAIDAEQLGQAVILVGGGRQRLGDRLDHTTGLEMLVRPGDPVAAGQPLVRLFSPPERVAAASQKILAAIPVTEQTPAAPAPGSEPLILEKIT